MKKEKFFDEKVKKMEIEIALLKSKLEILTEQFNRTTSSRWKNSVENERISN